jgi:RNA polymerase sigma-70 factor (ECF subfamily)
MAWFSSDNDGEVTIMSDEELLFASQLRPWLFAELIKRYEAAFLRKAQGIIRDPRDAEEIVQDTFTKIYKYADTFTPQVGATFSSWAYRILLNTTFTYYQRRVKLTQRYAELDPEYESFVADQTADPLIAERRDGVERILATLPEHFAYVLRLHYLERWPQEAIAAETGEHVGAIKVRIFRAKAAFRRACTGNEGDILV